MVDRNIHQFQIKQKSKTCIVFSYCLIMSHFTGRSPKELMTEFVQENTQTSYVPECLECAEYYLVHECYCKHHLDINNTFMKRYHLNKYQSGDIKLEYKSLGNADHVEYIKQKLINGDALLSASYEFERPSNWHCTPIGYDSIGFYLVQTNRGYNNFEPIADLNNLRAINYVKAPGDCLLIYKDS